jgi:hypothetical protein
MKRILLLIPLALSGCSHTCEERREIIKTALKEYWDGFGDAPTSDSDSDKPLLEHQVDYQLHKQARQAGTLP